MLTHEGSNSISRAPVSKDEGWRYSTAKLFVEAHENYRPLEVQAKNGVEANTAQYSPHSQIKNLMTDANYSLCFYNGVFLPGSSQINENTVRPLKLHTANDVRRSLDFSVQPNLAFFNSPMSEATQNGSFINIEKNGSEKIKVSIVYLYGSLSQATPFSVNPVNYINLAAHTHAEILESHIAVDDVDIFIKNKSEFLVGDQASLDLTQARSFGQKTLYIDDSQIHLCKDSQLQYFNLQLGGRSVHSEFSVQLNEEGGHAGVYGLTRAADDNHINTNSSVRHVKGHTTSDQVVKNVLFEKAYVSFSGRLRIELDAQKSMARQYCHNLLMNSAGEANCRPQLEVYADDVKAAHGATVGQANPEDLFYLQSRAISALEAKNILSTAFQRELIDKMQSSFLKDKAMALLSGATI